MSLFNDDAKILRQLMRGCHITKYDPLIPLWLVESSILFHPLKRFEEIFIKVLKEFPESYLLCEPGPICAHWESGHFKDTWKIPAKVSLKDLYNILYTGDWMIYKPLRGLDEVEPGLFMFMISGLNQENVKLYYDIAKINLVFNIAASPDCNELLAGAYNV